LRKGEAQRYGAESFPFLEKGGVEEVAGGGMTAVEEERGSEDAASGELSSAFLYEATEGGETYRELV
jgi:hypothetical protein